MPGRVAKLLLQLAQRFGIQDDGALRVTHELTQEEIAQLVGASRETVNKAHSWLQSLVPEFTALGGERLALLPDQAAPARRSYTAFAASSIGLLSYLGEHRFGLTGRGHLFARMSPAHYARSR